jgi:hypothetical protein
MGGRWGGCGKICEIWNVDILGGVWAVSDQEIGFPFDELRSSVATTGRSGIMGLSRVGCKTEIANRLLTGDPETVDTIKYMETVCDWFFAITLSTQNQVLNS